MSVELARVLKHYQELCGEQTGKRKEIPEWGPPGNPAVIYRFPLNPYQGVLKDAYLVQILRGVGTSGGQTPQKLREFAELQVNVVVELARDEHNQPCFLNEDVAKQSLLKASSSELMDDIAWWLATDGAPKPGLAPAADSEDDTEDDAVAEDDQLTAEEIQGNS